jgi:threonine synthase
VTVATLRRLVTDGTIRPTERVVIYITGHGLKAVEAVASEVGVAATIPATVEGFRAAFDPKE